MAFEMVLVDDREDKLGLDLYVKERLVALPAVLLELVTVPTETEVVLEKAKDVTFAEYEIVTDTTYESVSLIKELRGILYCTYQQLLGRLLW